MPTATPPVEKIPLHEVKDNRWEDLLRHETNVGGEYLCFAGKEEYEKAPSLDKLTAVIVCPRCKRPMQCKGIKVLSEYPLTLASIITCQSRPNGPKAPICGFTAEVRDSEFCVLRG